jgi:hypothetical protein
MIIRAVQAADASEWLRMRLALWPDATPENEASEIAHFLAVPPRPVLSTSTRPLFARVLTPVCVVSLRCRFITLHRAARAIGLGIWKHGMSIRIGVARVWGAPWSSKPRRGRVRRAVGKWLRIQHPAIP